MKTACSTLVSLLAAFAWSACSSNPSAQMGNDTEASSDPDDSSDDDDESDDSFGDDAGGGPDLGCIRELHGRPGPWG